jgi:hypothetical protein
MASYCELVFCVVYEKQWLLFDQWHADKRKQITSACFMASYCELLFCVYGETVVAV